MCKWNGNENGEDVNFMVSNLLSGNLLPHVVEWKSLGSLRSEQTAWKARLRKLILHLVQSVCAISILLYYYTL